MVQTMMRRIVPTMGVMAAVASLVTCRGSQHNDESAAPSASSSSSGSVRNLETTLASGMTLRLRDITPLSTRSNHEGDPVRATAVSAALSEHGDTVIPADAEFLGSVTKLAPGKPNKRGELELSFTEVRWGGHRYPVATRVTSVVEESQGRGITGGTAGKVGAGAVAGGILGRIIGGNKTGTIIGGAAGAAAGGAYAHQTRDIDLVVPAGSTIRVVLTRAFSPEVASR